MGAEATDAVFANHIAVAQSGTHIVEVVLQESLHENAFLQHAYPDIALLVFQNAGNLALGEVDESAEERIFLCESGAWIIYRDAQSVASYEEAAVSADVDIIYRQVSDRWNPAESPGSGFEDIDTCVACGKIDVAQPVLLDILCSQSFRAGEIRGDFAVGFSSVEFSVFSYNPESSPFIFQHPSDILQLFHLTLQGMAFSGILFEEHDAVTGSADEDILVAQGIDLRNVCAEFLVPGIKHRDRLELATVIFLQ